MKALIGIGLCAALLGGCAALPGRDGPRECSQQLGQEQELQMNMVRDMIREGRMQAALANLESMPPGLLDVREERALILRRIGDPRSMPLSARVSARSSSRASCGVIPRPSWQTTRSVCSTVMP
ncbi:hypothetical protein QM291_30430, partial [Pseudomonas aeruginosa]|nr:hypothetical protein [Pseudomonas aeruginosa]